MAEEHDPMDMLTVALTPVELAVGLSLCRPSGLYIAAATAGVDVAWMRWERGRDLAEASRAISAALPARWADQLVGHDEILRRQFPPTGDPATWVRFGPDGPPDNRGKGAA